MPKAVCAGTVFFIALSMLFPVKTRAARQIPDDNLAYPVLINLSNCTGIQGAEGSGFFLNTETATYLITAGHVLFGYFEGEYQPDRKPICKQAILISYSKDPKEKGQNIFVLDLETLHANKSIKTHITQDVSLIHIGLPESSNGEASLRGIPGVIGIQSSPSGILGVALKSVKKFDEVLTANEIYVFGYPTSIGLRNTPQIDYLKPLVRKGIASGANEQKKTIILDCFVFPGNSGGPVFQVEQTGINTTRFWIIGIISEFIPIAETWLNERFKYRNTQMYNSGYSIAIPMDMVLELVNQPPSP